MQPIAIGADCRKINNIWQLNHNELILYYLNSQMQLPCSTHSTRSKPVSRANKSDFFHRLVAGYFARLSTPPMLSTAVILPARYRHALDPPRFRADKLT
jgi:hypothetical protein